MDLNSLAASQIKYLRNERKIRQYYLASALHISPSAYNRIENGSTQITVNMLNEIAALLNVPPQELLKI